MISSRKLEDLHPTVKAMADAFLSMCRAQGIDVLVTCTYRDAEEQNRLYAIGRTVPGRKVTNAKAGQSAHNYRLAFDVVPLRHGKPVWGTSGEDGALWNKIGTIGESVGLEWAGRWRTFRELPHMQWTGGLTMKQLQAGMHPGGD